MNFTNFLHNTCFGLKPKNRFTFDFVLDNYGKTKVCHYNQNVQDESPPLSMTINKNTLAITTEFGNISLVNKLSMKLIYDWQGHNNAIFDIKWRTKHDQQLLTASGDRSIILWDLDSHECSVKLVDAHNSSIKSLSLCDTNIFASGARDGNIKLWDIRCPNGQQEIAKIPDAHLSSLSSASKRNKNINSRSNPLNSVTCVLFSPGTELLYSSGANDGIIKLWDMRKLTSKQKVKPLLSLSYTKDGSLSGKGFTSLALDENSRLYASCSDHKIYRYESSSNSNDLKFFKGHKVNNYTKIKIFNDYLISGSTDGKAYIWCLSQIKNEKDNFYSPNYLLPHDIDEIAVVDCDQNFNIFTCSDDQFVNKWELATEFQLKKLHPSLKVEKYIRKEVEIINQLQPLKRKIVSSTPIVSPITPSPFSSLSNWLKTRDTNATPSYSKCPKMSNTPIKTKSKENRAKHKKSKKLLFHTNKIDNYFTEDLIA